MQQAHYAIFRVQRKAARAQTHAEGRAIQFESQSGSGDGQVRRKVNGNGLSYTPRVVVNRWLTGINKDAKAKTTWYLLPDPNGPRPAVYASFLQWHLTGSVTGYVLAHAAIGVPFVLISVTSALGGFDTRLLRASASLGASPARTFVRVTMPLIGRGIATGAVFAFVTSFDEVVIALFLRSPTFQTLPVQMYNSVTYQLDPTIAASSSLVVVSVTFFLLLPQLVRTRRPRREGDPR